MLHRPLHNSMCPTFIVRRWHHSDTNVRTEFHHFLGEEGVGIVRDQDLRLGLVHDPSSQKDSKHIISSLHVGLAVGVSRQGLSHAIVSGHVHHHHELHLEVNSRDLPLGDVDSKMFPRLRQRTYGHRSHLSR